MQFATNGPWFVTSRQSKDGPDGAVATGVVVVLVVVVAVAVEAVEAVETVDVVVVVIRLQFRPEPLHPVLHSHANEPIVFMHRAIG